MHLITFIYDSSLSSKINTFLGVFEDFSNMPVVHGSKRVENHFFTPYWVPAEVHAGSAVV